MYPAVQEFFGFGASTSIFESLSLYLTLVSGCGLFACVIIKAVSGFLVNKEASAPTPVKREPPPPQADPVVSKSDPEDIASPSTPVLSMSTTFTIEIPPVTEVRGVASQTGRKGCLNVETPGGKEIAYDSVEKPAKPKHDIVILGDGPGVGVRAGSTLALLPTSHALGLSAGGTVVHPSIASLFTRKQKKDGIEGGRFVSDGETMSKQEKREVEKAKLLLGSVEASGFDMTGLINLLAKVDCKKGVFLAPVRGDVRGKGVLHTAIPGVYYSESLKREHPVFTSSLGKLSVFTDYRGMSDKLACMSASFYSRYGFLPDVQTLSLVCDDLVHRFTPPPSVTSSTPTSELRVSPPPGGSLKMSSEMVRFVFDDVGGSRAVAYLDMCARGCDILQIDCGRIIIGNGPVVCAPSVSIAPLDMRVGGYFINGEALPGGRFGFAFGSVSSGDHVLCANNTGLDNWTVHVYVMSQVYKTDPACVQLRVASPDSSVSGSAFAGR